MVSNWKEPFGARTHPELRGGGFRPGFERGRPLMLTTSATCGVRHRTLISSMGLAAFRQAIFNRDFDTCQFCGLRSKKYQDVLAEDGFDRSARAVFTACIFCSQCLMLESVESLRSGVLIWLPEMSQAALHQVMRVVYVLRIKQGLPAEKARRVLDLFIGRRQAAAERLTSDHPAFLAERMGACSTAEELSELRRKLRDIRLLPLDRRIIREADLEFNQFPQILAYWRSKNGPYASLAGGEGEQEAVALLDAVLEGWVENDADPATKSGRQ